MIHIFNFYIIHLHNLHLLFSNTRFQENVKCEIWKSQLVGNTIGHINCKNVDVE